MNRENNSHQDNVSMESPSVGANYQYWREHGGEWADEYEQRKKRLVYYHLQELMLADYFSHSASARILEYGCGVGRHLSYLSQIPGLDVYGYDQSQSMVNNMLRWASPEWFEQHVTVGSPTGKLPYPDNHFDIVYTAEVLIHVNPADLELLLAELGRISHWQILHLEPSPDFDVSTETHAGCWNHDIISSYQRIGYSCERLGSGFESQSPYRVILADERQSYTWSSVNLALYHQLEQDIQPTLNQIPPLNQHIEGLNQHIEGLNQHIEGLNQHLQDAQTTIQTLHDQINANYEAFQEQISAYEHRLQSQDLMTRHFVSLTFNNIREFFLHPKQTFAKFRRWYRARAKRESITNDTSIF